MMKILLVGQLSKGALGLSYKRAFEKLGWSVRYFDQKGEYQDSLPFGKLAPKIAHRSEVFRKLSSRKLNDKLKKVGKKFDPDLVVIIKGLNIRPQTIQKIRQETSSLIIHFNPDNPFNPVNSSDYLLQSMPEYDCLLIWGRFLLEKLEKYNDRVHYLPFGFDPELHKLDNNPETEKDIDIAFVGSWTKNRERWLNHLKDYDLHIWGNHWEKLPRGSELSDHWEREPIYGEGFVKVCQRAKIMLNFIRNQNGDAHNMRTFEVPGSGGFLLTERTKEQCELFEETEEIECFSDPKELREKIDYYLKHEKERKRIAAAGKRKAHKNTYLERAKRILEIYKDIHG